MARPETRKRGGSPASAQNQSINGAILGADVTARNASNAQVFAGGHHG